eukprot:481880-Prymnesium_polylepis.1
MATLGGALPARERWRRHFTAIPRNSKGLSALGAFGEPVVAAGGILHVDVGAHSAEEREHKKLLLSARHVDVGRASTSRSVAQMATLVAASTWSSRRVDR